MKKLATILPHILIILSGMFLTFLTIDIFNSAMGFINNDITKTLMFVFCILTVITSILFISLQRRIARAKNRKHQ
ncbi:MAG: hypothetical protein RRY79_00120 [Clostridia bacterium]